MKFKNIAYKISYTGVLCAFALLLNIFTMPDTPVGTISFTYIPCVLAGILLGPILGFAVGFTADLLGCFISPKGPISLAILIASGLIGLIAGLIFKYIRTGNVGFRIFLTYLIVLFVCTLGLSSIGNYVVSGFLQNKYITYWEYLLVSRVPKQPFVLLLNGFLNYGMVKLLLSQASFRKMMCFVKK